MQNQHTRESVSATKDVTQTQQQRPESPAVTLTCHRCKYKVHKLHQRYILAEDAPCQVSCRRRLRSLLLCLCDAFGAFFPVAKSNRLEANLHYSWHPSTPGYRGDTYSCLPKGTLLWLPYTVPAPRDTTLVALAPIGRFRRDC